MPCDRATMFVHARSLQMVLAAWFVVCGLLLTGCGTDDDVTVAPVLESTFPADIDPIHGDLFADLADVLPGDNVAAAIPLLLAWLEADSRVDTVYAFRGSIEYRLQSGRYGGIIFVPEEAMDEEISRNSSRPQDAIIRPAPVAVSRDDEPVLANVITNRKAFLFSPFGGTWPRSTSLAIRDILLNAGIGYTDANIVHHDGASAQLSRLTGLTDYGIVFFDTHADLPTRTPYDPSNDQYEAWVDLGRLGVKEMTRGLLRTRVYYYTVRPPFISDVLGGQFPNSVVFVAACYSSFGGYDQSGEWRDYYWPAFAAKGAQAYFGFDDLVTSGFTRQTITDVVRGMAIDRETTGEAFVPGQTDPHPVYDGEFELQGNENLHLGVDQEYFVVNVTAPDTNLAYGGTFAPYDNNPWVYVPLWPGGYKYNIDASLGGSGWCQLAIETSPIDELPATVPLVIAGMSGPATVSYRDQVHNYGLFVFTSGDGSLEITRHGSSYVAGVFDFQGVGVFDSTGGGEAIHHRSISATFNLLIDDPPQPENAKIRSPLEHRE